MSCAELVVLDRRCHIRLARTVRLVDLAPHRAGVGVVPDLHPARVAVHVVLDQLVDDERLVMLPELSELVTNWSRRLPGWQNAAGGIPRKPSIHEGSRGDGRYWARTSDPQLVELVLSQLS